MKKSLKEKDETLFYDKCSFIVTAEVEDEDSIHHVILLPDFESTDALRKLLKPHSPNLNDEWGGRPRVNTNAEQIAGFVRDVGGMIGPAHAFTPFKAIFRENKYGSLLECYGSEANNVHFPTTWPNASSPIYDIEGPAPLEGPNCSRLFIWNIADDSLLKASYLSVSGHHPKDSGYHGPSGNPEPKSPLCV